jgi:hypothetical protein
MTSVVSKSSKRTIKHETAKEIAINWIPESKANGKNEGTSTIYYPVSMLNITCTFLKV